MEEEYDSVYCARMYSSFKFHPYRFLRKSYFDEEIEECVKSAFKDIINKRKGYKHCFHMHDGDVYIDMNEVTYIEVLNHTLSIHLADGKNVLCTGSLSEVEKNTKDLNFVRTHKSYLVNCKYIFVVGYNYVKLEGDIIVPISKTKSKKVNQEYMMYLRKI